MTDTPNDRLKQIGQIKHYMPFKMVFALLVFIGFIAYMHEDLYVRFMAHPSLNALIIGTMVVSIAAAFHNIFKIEKSASLLRKLEKYEDDPSEAASKTLIKKLRKKNCIINTFYLEGAIMALHEAGSLKFSDNQSRVMKSKVGQRTSRMRHGVQYMAGVLVMLGLIGTFWGLLATITSVGEAMSAIVESFSKSSESGGQATGMVDFLKAISKPLQGMGIAFSASLFGLSGSLMTGLLNSFCGKGMDKFLEDFSNWVDARIPEMQKREDAGASLAGQSQQMMSMFSQVITAMTNFSSEQAAFTHQLSLDKRETTRLANSFENGINTLSSNMASMSESLAMLPLIVKEVRNEVRDINHVLLTSQQSLLDQQKLANEQLVEYSSQGTQLYKSISRLIEDNRMLANAHIQIAEALENLHDDTIDQKDKIIEMVLVMQHILQTQLEHVNEITTDEQAYAQKRI